MAVKLVGYICKMCGKLLACEEGSGICECESCGSRQTVPKMYKGKYEEIYNRACELRFKTDFEGAEKLFSKLCTAFPDEPEGYWGKMLCRCGVLYENESVSGLKMPVCHKAYDISLKDDDACCMAIVLADAEQSAVYRREAAAIEMLRHEKHERVGSGIKYDVYICCRMDDNGENSEDSAIADEVYRQLSREGLRVFYSHKTADKKASKDMANPAINSARVLIIVSASAESFASPRFKSEWGRCAAAARKDTEKLVAVCIKNTDIGEVPAELSEYRIMDVSEMSFLAELIRAVRQSIGGSENVEIQGAASRSVPEKLIRRMNIFLADEDFEAAEEYSDMILDAAPECWQAHFAKFLSFNGCRSTSDLLLGEVVSSFADDYIKRYGFDFSDDEAFSEQFKGMLGDSARKAVEYADGEDRLMIATVFERFESAVRDEVFAREQEKIDGEEMQELDEMRRRHEADEEKRQADTMKRKLIRNRFLAYMGAAAALLLFMLIRFRAKWAAVCIVLLIVFTVIVITGTGKKKA